MKNCKKILSIVLVIIMLTSVLTGCGSKSNKPTVDTLVGFAQKTIEDSESVDLVLNMILDMEIEEDEYKIPVKMDIMAGVQSHYESDTAYLLMTAGMNILGNELTLERESYIVDEDGTLFEYARQVEDDNDTGWLKEETSGFSFEDPSGNIFEIIDDNLENFELWGDCVEYAGESCYAISGYIDGAGDMLKDLDFEDFIGEVDYSALSVYITAYFLEDTKIPYAVVLDMTDSFAELYSEEESADVETFMMTLNFNSFNEIDEITVPKKVMNAVGNYDDQIVLPTETAPVEDVTEPTENTTEPVANASADWKDFQFTLNGKTFTLPCTYEELKEATGLTMKSSEEKSYLEPNYYSVVSLRTADDKLACHVDILNNAEEDATYASGLIIEISQDDYNVEQTGMILEIAGLKVGDITSKEALIDLFGEPDDIYEYRIDEDDDQEWVKYQNDTYTWCLDADWTTSNFFEIVMNINTGIIEEIRLDHSYFD